MSFEVKGKNIPKVATKEILVCGFCEKELTKKMTVENKDYMYETLFECYECDKAFVIITEVAPKCFIRVSSEK